MANINSSMERDHSIKDEVDRLAQGGLFNPDYRPYAKECWDAAVKEATEQEEGSGSGKEWTRKRRAFLRLVIYAAKMTSREMAVKDKDTSS